MFKIDHESKVTIACSGESAVRFAAEELARYIKMMTGAVCTLKSDADCCGSLPAEEKIIRLGCGEAFLAKNGIDASSLKWDGFALAAEDNELAIGGKEPRSALFGVYFALAEAGCKFIRGAGVEEKIPTKDFVLDGWYYKNPSFRRRGITVAVTEYNKQWCNEAIQFVDWCAKNFINAVFLHESLEIALDSYNEQVISEIKKRDLLFEFGGHGAQDFVPKSLFAAHPERFIQKDGKRTEKGNFCVSCKENIRDLTKRVQEYAGKDSKIDLLHLWFEDTLNGSWCDCEQCRDKSPAKQLETCIRAAAETAENAGGNTEIAYLFYHDTMERLHELGSPAENTVAFYCPRERCYAHAMNDKTCKLNGKYADILQDLIELYGADRVEIFDYYMDFILFNKVKTLIPATIAGDLKYYKEAGVERLCPLSFGNYSFWAYDLNLYVYAKHSFDAELDVNDTVNAYIADFGFGTGYKAYLDLMQDFSRKYFSFCGYPGGYYDIRGLELCAYFGEHIAKIQSALVSLAKAKKFLEAYKMPAGLEAYGEYEKTLIGVSLLEAEGLCQRMQVRYKNYTENPKDKTEAAAALENIKPRLYEMIDIIGRVPDSVKGVAGGASFVDGLCKTQIWTLNELMKLELGLDVDLSQSV